MTVQRSHWATRTWGRGPPRGNGMPGDQRIWRFVDPTSGCRVMSSCRSHEKAVQGQLVNLGPGAKNQMERWNCVSSAPASVYGQCWRGRPPTLSRSRVLQSWPTNARFALKCTRQKTSLGNEFTMASLGH